MPKLFQIFLIISLLTLSSTLKCGEQTIEYCLKCGTLENSDTCVKCPETHFLYNHNFTCVACNDIDLGDVGCEKNCVFHDSNEFLECDDLEILVEEADQGKPPILSLHVIQGTLGFQTIRIGGEIKTIR